MGNALRDLNDLVIFAAVVSHGGISAAARALGQPKSRISRRVAALEERLGIRLLERTTRRFRVTDLGQEVYGHARALISEADAIDEAAQRLKIEPQGLVRVSCPVEIDRLIGMRLPEFLKQHPKLSLQMLVSNRRVDIVEEGVDIAIRVRERLDTDADLQIRIISQTGLEFVASPAFTRDHGRPEHPADLAGFPVLLRSDRGGVQQVLLSKTNQETVEVSLEPRLSASAFPILLQAACEDVGIAGLPEYVARAALASGALVRVLPDWTTGQGVMHLVFASRRGLLPGVRATIDFLTGVLSPKSDVWGLSV